MNALTVIAVGLLGVIIGISIGARITARRYQQALRERGHHMLDLSRYQNGE